MKQKENCCENKKSKGLLSGILLGIIPHSFCIAFIIFSAIGSVFFTSLSKKFLMIPYFFHLLIFISILFATILSVFYLKKCNCLHTNGMKSKWKYLTTLYLSTIVTNLFIFFVVMPALANTGQKNENFQENLSALSLNVDIPCSGHAPLIIDELQKEGRVSSVEFENPNFFKIKYNPKETSPEKIASLKVFKTYKAKLN